MGSCILSRSFHVSPWTGENEDKAPAQDEEPADPSAMDVDPPAPSHHADTPDTDEASQASTEDEDDPADVAMVPMADMLNARFETENVSFLSSVMPSVLTFIARRRSFSTKSMT